MPARELVDDHPADVVAVPGMLAARVAEPGDEEVHRGSVLSPPEEAHALLRLGLGALVGSLGRDLGIDYVVEGTVRRGGDRVRISVQLVDAKTGAQLWSDRYEGATTDVFSFQDRIAAQVAGAILPALRNAEIDLARPKENVKTSGFRPEERKEFDRWITSGWVDTFRHFEKAGGHYSWWSQRFGVRERNIGWRLDYVLASPGAMPYVRSAAIHPEVKGSDHCRVSVELDPKVM